MIAVIVKLILHNFAFLYIYSRVKLGNQCFAHFQKSQTPKMAAPKRNPVFEPPQIFRTEDYFRQQPVASATSECTSGFSNGTVASSCNSHVLPIVPSDSRCVSDPQGPVLVADIHELTHTGCSDCTVVDQVSKNESTHTSVVISDTQPLNDNS